CLHASSTFLARLFCPFLLHCHGAPRDLHSFPTRRSSDLDPPPFFDGFNDEKLLKLAASGAQGLHYRPVTVQKFGHRLATPSARRSEEHTSELQSRENLVCRLLLEKNNCRKLDLICTSLT